MECVLGTIEEFQKTGNQFRYELEPLIFILKELSVSPATTLIIIQCLPLTVISLLILTVISIG
jgi:hypothetical protein